MYVHAVYQETQYGRFVCKVFKHRAAAENYVQQMNERDRSVGIVYILATVDFVD